VSKAGPAEDDGLVLPGGVANPDLLRTDADAVGFVKSIFEQGKPVGVICHGPWTLVEAGVVKGRTITSWPSLRTDIIEEFGEGAHEAQARTKSRRARPPQLPASAGARARPAA
jgi:deglycase